MTKMKFNWKLFTMVFASLFLLTNCAKENLNELADAPVEQLQKRNKEDIKGILFLPEESKDWSEEKIITFLKEKTNNEHSARSTDNNQAYLTEELWECLFQICVYESNNPGLIVFENIIIVFPQYVDMFEECTPAMTWSYGYRDICQWGPL